MTSPLQQKLKISGPAVVTANRLSDGAVVYRTAARNWSTSLDDAQVVMTAAAATQLLSDSAADDVGAVGAYVAPVDIKDGHVAPANLRERIRQQGLTFDLPATFGI